MIPRYWFPSITITDPIFWLAMIRKASRTVVSGVTDVIDPSFSFMGKNVRYFFHISLILVRNCFLLKNRFSQFTNYLCQPLTIYSTVKKAGLVK
jgi:hypothetical protein